MVFFKRFKARRLRKKIGYMIKNRQENAVSDQIIAKEIQLHYHLAKLYKLLIGNHKEPFARESMLECYRMAASIGDLKAHFLLGEALLEEGKFWQELYNSDFTFEVYKTYQDNVFLEAFRYLEEAESQGYALAKRQLGLAYINGWGKEVDGDKGFKKIVESIDMLGEWPKVTEIFKKLNLNKPEFYAQLTNLQKGG